MCNPFKVTVLVSFHSHNHSLYQHKTNLSVLPSDTLPTYTYTTPSLHVPSVCLIWPTYWPILMQQRRRIVCLNQNSSSALLQRDCLSRVRRASTSATDSSPWTLLSLVRTLTLLVIFSFSPTTAKTRGDKQLDMVQVTPYTPHMDSYPNTLL